MTIEATLLPNSKAEIAKKTWTAPLIHMLDINAAEGANAGPLCDKHGSQSATLGNDRCDSSTK